jgi:hypothetical protein
MIQMMLTVLGWLVLMGLLRRFLFEVMSTFSIFKRKSSARKKTIKTTESQLRMRQSSLSRISLLDDRLHYVARLYI